VTDFNAPYQGHLFSFVLEYNPKTYERQFWAILKCLLDITLHPHWNMEKANHEKGNWAKYLITTSLTQ